jgi:sulfite reductase beta subunit-like hemoprotein
MVITGPDASNKQAEGTIYVTQTGTRSGLQIHWLDKPKAGALLIFKT